MTSVSRRHHPTTHPKREKFQGREITATLQAPNEMDLDMMITDLQDYAQITGMEPIQILSKGPDPDGGYKAVITAHNFNPVTWLTEKGYRAYLGVKHGPAIGKAKAIAKHQVGAKAEIAQAAEEEALRAQRKLAIRRAVEAERRRAEPELAVARQRTRYGTSEKPLKDVLADLNESIFGKASI